MTQMMASHSAALNPSTSAMPSFYVKNHVFQAENVSLQTLVQARLCLHGNSWLELGAWFSLQHTQETKIKLTLLSMLVCEANGSSKQ